MFDDAEFKRVGVAMALHWILAQLKWAKEEKDERKEAIMRVAGELERDGDEDQEDSEDETDEDDEMMEDGEEMDKEEETEEGNDEEAEDNEPKDGDVEMKAGR